MESKTLLQYLDPITRQAIICLANSGNDFDDLDNRPLANALALALIRESRIRAKLKCESRENCEPREALLYQYWDQDVPPHDVSQCMATWASIPGIEVRQFNAASAREFIGRMPSSDYIEAFDCCYHPAMQCDYFRLAALSVTGGLYVDADEEWTGHPLDVFRATEDIWLRWLRIDHRGGPAASAEEVRAILDGEKEPKGISFYFNNSPIACKGHDPVITIALRRATRNLLACRREGKRADIHKITGPTNITASVLIHFLSSLKTGASFDVSAIDRWALYSNVRRDLQYQKTIANWRVTEGMSEKQLSAKG